MRCIGSRRMAAVEARGAVARRRLEYVPNMCLYCRFFGGRGGERHACAGEYVDVGMEVGGRGGNDSRPGEGGERAEAAVGLCRPVASQATAVKAWPCVEEVWAASAQEAEPCAR